MAYCIEIYMNDDGSLEVGMEQKAEPMEGEEGGEQREPAADIKDALTKALELYKKSQETEPDEDAFSQGFGNEKAAPAAPVERGMIG